MLYKGQRSRTPPVYSLFKFQSKFMFCKWKTVFLLLYFKYWRTLHVKEYEWRYKIGLKRLYFKLKVYAQAAHFSV